MDEALTQLEQAVTDLLDRPAWSLRDTDLVAGLARLSAVTTQLAAVNAALVREIDGRAIPAAHGASSTPVWLREQLRISIHTARRMADLATLLDARPALRDALASGIANPEQAAAIGTTLAELPNDLDPTIINKAETLLVDQAGQFEPTILRHLGQRILTHIAPQIAEEVLRRKLDQDELRAQLDRTLTITSHGHRSRLSGWLDTEATAMLTAALDPLCRPTPTAEGIDARTPGQRRADALTEICRLALASDQLPTNGGEATRLTVTVDYDVLTRQLGPGILDTGQPLSPTTVRRLACDAQIIPAVLGSNSAVLDLGRTQRRYTGAARRALILRDGGCAFPGCDRPPHWCHGHHLTSWLDGGSTDLDNAVLLCARHHRVIHQGHWQVKLGPDRRPEFIPPAYVDPDRKPRHNTYHQRP